MPLVLNDLEVGNLYLDIPFLPSTSDGERTTSPALIDLQVFCSEDHRVQSGQARRARPVQLAN